MRTEADVVESMKVHFAKVSDPRVAGRTDHLLVEILVMALIGVLAGADDFVGIALIAKGRESWFRQFLELKNGVPSDDTFRRVFRLIDPKEVTLSLIEWIKTFQESRGSEIINIDGKALRRSGSKKGGLKILYTVCAWVARNGLILGQEVVDDKSNEITAIPQLLKMLDIAKCTVTIDAAGCQKNIAAEIVEKKGHYVLAVKGNQPTLEADLLAHFNQAVETAFAGMRHECIETEETHHGRTEYRATHILELPKDFSHKEDWAQLNTMVVVLRRWTEAGDEFNEKWDQRIYISSHRFNSPMLRRAPRSHWGIENSLHWVLDVQFREDDHQLRDRKAASNLAFLRRLAVSILRQDKHTKCGAKNKRLVAACDPDYILKVLCQARF